MPSSRAKSFWCKLSDVLPQQPDFEDAAHFGRACVWLSSGLDAMSVSPNAGCKCQLGLGEAECLSGMAHHVAQVFWRFDLCRHVNFLFGKLCYLKKVLSNKLTDREIMDLFAFGY